LKQSIRELPPINHDYQPVIARKMLSASRWMRRSQTIDFLFHCGRSGKTHRPVIAPKQFHRMQLY
jgi:hypothetical protein